MKKASIALLFVIVFVATYLVICFAIPGMRIKLDAAPAEYFLASIRHMAFVKTAASLVTALMAGAFPFLFNRR